MQGTRLARGLRKLLASLFLTTPLLPLQVEARVDVLDRVEYAAVSAGTEIRVFLHVPMQYETHMPRKAGDRLQIELRNVTVSLALDPELQGRQILTPPPSDDIPLSEVWYEFEPQESPRLILYFTRQVRFSARSAPDFRSIIVTLPKAPSAPGAETIQRPLPTAPPAAEAVQPKPERRQPPQQTVAEHPRKPEDEPVPSAPAVNVDYAYVINLESARKPFGELQALNLGTEGRFVAYTTEVTVNGRLWYRLRLGFFPTKKTATVVRNILQYRFPDAWVTKAPREERILAATQAGTPAMAAAPRPRAPTKARPTVPSAPAARASQLPAIAEERLKKIMDDARQAMTAGDYRRAIQLYTKVLQYPDHPYRQDAQEFLGLARERKGQLAHAKAEYTEYLELYPEDEGAERVRQRLQGLATAREQPRGKLRKAKKRDGEAVWMVFGGFSQFYRRDWSRLEPVDETTVDQSSLDSNLDMSARRVSARHDLRARFTGGYLQNFLSQGPNSDPRANAAYLDATDKKLRVSARLGRQSRNTGGVLGRFDGGVLSYRVKPLIQVNGVAGFPVESTTKGIETDRHFYGVSFDLGPFAKTWNFIPYYIEQKVDGLTDRQAAGMEVRYFQPGRSLLGLVDYDIHFTEVNTALFLGNWTIPSWVTVTATADYRKSPVLRTSNALQGQPVQSIDDLQTIFSNEEIKQLAKDRTSSSRTLTLGLSRPLNEKLQLTGDVTMTRLSDTPTSGGVEGMDSTGNEFFYSAQLIGNSLIKRGDIAILGLRYADASNADILTFNLDTRYPVSRSWRLNPRVRVDYRKNDDRADQLTLAPTLRTTYVIKRRMTLELDAGAEFSTEDLADESNDSTAYFLSAGYRLDF